MPTNSPLDKEDILLTGIAKSNCLDLVIEVSFRLIAMLCRLLEGSLEEFKVIHEEILRKGELTEFYERLKLPA